MWEALIASPRGRLSARKFIVLFATASVACLSYIFVAAPVVYAANATWEDNGLVYNSNLYHGPSDTSGKKGLKGIPNDAQIYEYKKGRQASIIYFPGGAVPRSEGEATYVTYTLNPPNQYSSPSDKSTISIDSATDNPPEGVSEGSSSQCQVDGLGWILCPLADLLADAVDNMYNLIASFLEVQPITGGNNSLYRMWDVSRDVANLLFVIGFLIIIYSYLAGGVGGDSYNLRRIIPRIVVAAILVNVSYWICSIAVDISNILGASIQAVFESIRDTAIGTEQNTAIDWKETTAYILSGGTIGTLAFLAATGGSILSLASILLGILITVAFAAFIALVVLAARQAIIIILIIIAPLAFAAYILPNTEKWFDKWRSVFMTLLLVFPIFSVIFGGSQLAAVAIMQNASSAAILLFGMAVQVVPLVLTPLLIQFSGSLIGRIAGIANNSGKGIVDRGKNWANQKAEFHKDRNLARPNNKWNRANVARRGAQRMYARKVAREKQHETYKKDAENLAHSREFGTGRMAQSRAGQALGVPGLLNRNSYGNWDQRYRNAELEHQGIEAHHEADWEKQFALGNDRYNPEMTKKRLGIENQRNSVREAQETFKTTSTAASTYQTINDSDSDEVKKAKREHNQSIKDKHGLDESFKTQMQSAREISQSIAVQGLAVKGAEVVAQAQLAKMYRDNIKIRPDDKLGAVEVAAGIDPTGRTKVEAQAQAALTKQHMENVEALNSIYSDQGYTTEELFKITQGQTVRGKASTDMHKHAAIQTIMTKNKGNNWAAQKLFDLVTEQEGMNYDSQTNTFTDATGTTLSSSEVSSRRDTQQILNDAISKSPLKVDYISATLRSQLETGTLKPRQPGTTTSEEAIMYDMKQGKFSQERVVSADVDVLQRMVQVFRDPSKRQQIDNQDPQARARLLKTINDAQNNPQINAAIKDRERGVMNALAAFLDDSDTRSSTAKQQEYFYVLDANDNQIRVAPGTPGAQTANITVKAPDTYDPSVLY